FMEQSGGVDPADQNRLIRFALDEVGVVGNDGVHIFESLLRTVFVHPGAGLLSGARIRIEVPESDMLTLRIGDFPDPNVRSYGWNTVDFGEFESVQLTRCPEYGLAHFFEL